MKNFYQLTVKLVFSFVMLLLFSTNTWAQTENEDNGNFVTANLISSPGEVTGSVCTNDTDFFKIVLPSDGKYRVYIEATNAGSGQGLLYVSGYDQRKADGNFFNKTIAYYSYPGDVSRDSVDLYCRSAGDTIYYSISQNMQCYNYKISYTQIGAPSDNDVEPNNTFEEATSFNVGETVKGHIGYVTGNAVSDGYDYYKTVLPADGKYRIYMEGTNTGNGQGLLFVSGFDQRKANGNLFNNTIAYYSYPGDVSRDSIDFFCRSAGDTIYFRVSQSIQCFNYKITYKQIGAPSDNDVEPNNTFKEATKFNIGDTVKGHIGYVAGNAVTDGVDYFTTVLPADGKYRVYMEATNTGNGQGLLQVSGFDQRQDNGNLFNNTTAYYSYPNEVTKDSVDLFSRAAGDTIYFRVTQGGQCFSYKITYKQIGAPSDNDAEPNNTFKEAITFNVGDTAKGHIGYVSGGSVTDGVDYYKGVIPADGVVRVYMEATNTGNGQGLLFVSGFDKRQDNGNLFNNTPAYYSYPGEVTRDSVDLYCRSAGDTLYFRVTQSNQTFNYKISYKILPQAIITNNKDVEPNNIISQASLLNAKDSAIGHVGYVVGGVSDDVDYFKTKLPSKGTMVIRLQTTNTGSAQGLFYITAYDKNNNQVYNENVAYYNNRGEVTNSVINISCQTADSFYIRLNSSNSCYSYKLSYDVTLGADTTVYACSGCTTDISKLYNVTPFTSVKYKDIAAPDTAVNPESVRAGTYMLSVFNGTDECSRDTAIITVSTGQVINFDSIPDKTYGDAPFVVNATSSEGLAVTYKVLSGPATISGNTVTITGVGSVTIRAEQAGTSAVNYAFADRTFKVNKAPATITLADKTKVYDGKALTPTATTNPPSLPVTFTYNGNANAPVNAGTYVVVATINHELYTGSVTDTLVINKAQQTITLTPVADKEYGTQPFTVNATSTSGLPVSLSLTSDTADIATVNDKTITITGVGKVFLAADQAENENYLTAKQVLDTFIVTKGNQTISIDAITDKQFDDAPFNVNATATSGLPITYSLTSTPASGVASISGNTITLSGNAGTVTVTAIQAGNRLYNAAQAQTTFKVLPGAPDLIVQNVTSTISNLAPNDTVAVSWTTGNIGKAFSTTDWTERIFIQSTDGTNRTLLKQVVFANGDTLKVGKTISRSEKVTIPVRLNVGDQGVLVVELVPGATITETPGTQANNISVQQTWLTFKKQLTVELSSAQITEGNADGLIAKVTRSGSFADPLTVSLNFNNPVRFSFPATITIPSGQSAQNVTITAKDNTALEGTITDSLTISAAGFTGAGAKISILDDDRPSLTITQLPTEAMEGQTVVFRLNTDLDVKQALQVQLTSNNQARFPVPAYVTIPAGSRFVDVTVKLEQDQIAELDVPVNIIAGAANHNSTNATIQVKDDDVPSLQLVLQTNTVSESAGYYATKATLRRTGTNSSSAFTVSLSADRSNTLILPASISLAANENEKTFDVGVIENTQVDGDRKVTITASLYINSCGCTAPSTSAGSVATSLRVTDNDGPALTVTASQLTLAEGLANAGTIRITRNTGTENALTVSLSSSNTNEATVPATATIPAGQAYVDVPVTTINDNVSDGNQQVYFQATSNGYSLGSVWVIVSDQNKPDLQIPTVKLTNNSVQAMSVFNYQYSVKNTGFATAASGLVVRGYLSLDNVIDNTDTLVSEDVISEGIPAGQSIQIINAAKAPNLPGQYKLLFQANPDLTLTELLTTNNTSSPVSLTIKPDYTATVLVEQPYYLKGVTIPVTGSAVRSDGTAAGNEKVEVYILTNGLRRTVSATTDASGKFAAQFMPLANEAGHYTVGASYPGIGATAEQDNFDIPGVRLNGGTTPQFKVVLNQTVKGTLPVTNLSNTSLTNFSLVPATLPNGATIQFDPIAVLAGNATVNVGYTITGSALSQGNNFEIATLNAVAQQGNIQSVNLYYFCQAPNAYVEATISNIDVSASKSAGERLVEFKLVNKGQGSTGDVMVELPQVSWLTNVTPKKMASIAPGDTAFVVLKFLATQDVPFDYAVKGNIAINTVNGNSVSLPFSFKKVSESTGALKVTATDQFTYYAAGAPKVKDAHVVVKNYYTGQVYADGFTDSTGVLSAAGIPEGTHRVTVEKERHESYTGTININAGNTVETTAFLDYQAITFSWNVVPTAIQDQYDITLETKFETNVPKPVVTVDMPKTMPQLSGNETYAFNVTLTNHGLITANEVQLGLPNGDAEYEFVTNYVPANLLAQQSIQVPVIMRRRTQPGLGGKASFGAISQFLGIDGSQLKGAAALSGSCEDFASVHYWYFCNLSTGLWEKGGALFSYSGRSCTPSPTGHYNGLPIDVGYGGGGPGYNDVPCATCLPGGLTGRPITTTPTPPAKEEKKSCKKCIEAVADILGCAGPSGVKDAAKCVGKSVLKGAEWSEYLDCIPLPPPLNCLKSLNGAVDECSGTGVGGGGGVGGSAGRMADMAKLARTSASPLGAVFDRIAENLKLVEQSMTLRQEWIKEYYGDMVNSDALAQFRSYMQPSVTALDSIRPDKQQTVLAAMAGYEIQPDAMKAFFNRWNTSVYAYRQGILTPNDTYPNIVNWTKSKSYSDSIVILHKDAVSKGFESVEDMWAKEYKAMNEFVESEQNSVCASVTVQLSQRLTMTREAFEGTLAIFNGHPTDAMDSLSVNIKITDANGVPSNDLFEIQTKSLSNIANVTGTGVISSKQTAGVKFLFIPENGAAPTAPKVYNFSGSVTYLDPYAKTMVTMPLSSVPLTVNPSPNLMLHYFMERNILGDDANTSPDIEPSVPAELAVMVENQGYGSAVNMMISSAQPKIVENEKGLAINFNLIGSNFQGQPKKLGVTDINFGTIPALQTRIGQWYFTSSLLGKFVSYDAKVVHANSFGNPELSLVKGVKLHELTKSIKIYGSDDDGINDFLVNDIFDIKDVPDIIYFSQGNRTAKVYEAASGSFSSPVTPPTFTNTLTVAASNKGWNYVKLDDPGKKQYELVSVTRNDGQVIPLNNAWLTFVTLPVNQGPKYENKFHFVDTFPTLDPVTYTVVWKPGNTDVPKVDTIIGVPKEVTATQVQNLKVVFNKKIDPATFTYEDLALTFQGGANIMNNSVVITQIDTATFNVDLSSLTNGNGFYALTVQAANVADVYGTNGVSGRQVSWTQFLTVPVVQAFQGIPESRKASSFDKIQVLFNLPIDPTTVTAARFTIMKDSVQQAGTLTIDSVRADNKLFYLSGLKNILTQNGTYELVVDLPNIKSTSQVAGVQTQSITLTVDNTGPIVLSLEKSNIGGLDAEHIPYVNIKFDEEVYGFNTSALKLTRNGEVLPIRFDQLSNSDLKTWTAGNFGTLTYPDGSYTLTIDLTGVKDAIGNSGTGTKEISWTVNKAALVQITNLGVTPDRGYSNKDGVTSDQSITVTFNLSKDASQIVVSQVDLSGQQVLTTLNNVTAGDVSIPITLAQSGNTAIRITAKGVNGGEAVVDKTLYVDPIPLTGQWVFAANHSITRQVDTIPLALSSKLLSDAGFANAITFKKDGTALLTTGLAFKSINDTMYQVSGLRSAGTLAGTYELTFNLPSFAKYTSGKGATTPVTVTWTVLSTNRAPVANAGNDTTITKIGTVHLNGAASYDPDADSITYKWVAPEGIVLTDSTSAKPSFNVTTADQGKTYSFLLIVKDGSLFTTSVVKVKIDLAPDVILPITWLYFKGQQQGKDALLTWATVSELNSKSFVIERSLDGTTFNAIGIMASKGTSNQTTNYNYTDDDAMSLNTKVLYYRLRQVDVDGSVTYSTIVTLPVKQSNAPEVIVKAYPNPFEQQITLETLNVTSTRETDHVALYTLDGRQVYSRKLANTGNSTTLLKDLPNLRKGMYYLRVSIDGKLYTIKMMRK